MAKGILQPLTRRSGTLVLLETSLIIAAVIAGVSVVVGQRAWDPAAGILPRALLIAFLCQLCLYYADIYQEPRVVADRRELFLRVIQGLGAAALLLAALYFVFPALIIGRGVFDVAAVLIIVSVVGWRTTFSWVTRQIGPHERLLLVGTSCAGASLAEELYRREDLGVEIVGFVGPDAARQPDASARLRVIGTIDDVPALVRERRIDRVVVDLADARGKLPMMQLLDLRLHGVTFAHLATVYEEYTGKIAVENLRPSWFLFSSGFRKTKPLVAFKRAIDVALAVIGLVCAFPVMLVVAALVRATSHGPVLYRQNRVGQNGRVFTLFKVRTMRADAEASTGAVWSQPSDNRITPIGRLLRGTRLDELPQLWNVLIGDMSLIGPRPERPEFVTELTRVIPFYGQRHVVKPGLSGWAQVRFSYGASVEDAMEKLQYDLFYIKNMSIAFDLVIMFETVKTILLRRGR